MAGITRADNVRYIALTPNIQGFERARAAGVDEIAVFAAASETFSQKNINCTIEESLNRFIPVINAAKPRALLFVVIFQRLFIALMRARLHLNLSFR